MKVAYTISALGHAAILLWSIWTLSAKPLPPPPEALPVDLVDVSDLTQITKGAKNAPQADTPKPPVEKVAEAKPVDDTTAKIVEKKEVKAAREPPPAAEAKPAEPKPAKAEAKPDPIAEALAKEPAKKPETKKAEAKPAPAKKPAPPTPKFDPSKVAELLDKRDSQRLAAAGAVPSEASLGLADGTAAQLSQSELDAFRRRLQECWNPPPGVTRDTKLQVILRVLFKPDGSVARPPELVSGPASALGPPMADSAKRAVLSCQPFKMLKPEHYEQWKDIEINFDTQYMLQG
jgi:outer membrane biosynthesis protein TonB